MALVRLSRSAIPGCFLTLAGYRVGEKRHRRDTEQMSIIAFPLKKMAGNEELTQSKVMGVDVCGVDGWTVCIVINATNA